MVTQGLNTGYIEERPFVWGFAGTREEARMSNVDAPIFYVNAAHADANDNNDGVDPRYPMATLQGLIDRSVAGGPQPILQRYSTIYVGSGLSEDVYIPATAPQFVTLVGAGSHPWQIFWKGNTGSAATPCLKLGARSWRISNFIFRGKTGAAAIELMYAGDSGVLDGAIQTLIDHCQFNGQTTHLYGILTHGPYDVRIEDCEFMLYHNAGGTATAIFEAVSPVAIPYRNYIRRCTFFDNDNHVDIAANGTIVVDNVFQKAGFTYTATQVLRLTRGAGGDNNIVTRNTLTGDYSIVGGYRGGAADIWIGNYADDVAEAEVGDNGLTILPPA